MKKRLRRLIVFAGVMGLVMAVNMGVASADHPHFEGTTAATASAPVGSHIISPDAPGHPGADNGFGRIHNADGTHSTNFDNPAVLALFNNPNCPLHYLP
jgi:hypothetical protein